MIEAAILDTGPLVAFFHSGEQHHEWIVERFKELPPKFLTCEAVLTETCFLLGSASPAIDRLERFLELQIIRLPFQFAAEHQAVLKLMRDYRDAPMSLADACLVRMSELNPEIPVLTLDHHFNIYRRNRRGRIKTIMPS